jgi:formate dehydrogenase subunit gamma
VLEQPRGREWSGVSRGDAEMDRRQLPFWACSRDCRIPLIRRAGSRFEGGRSGRTLVRFNAFERLVPLDDGNLLRHLALSGLNITFGKELLLPILGPETFAAWSQWAKYAHNYLSFPFTLGVVLILLMWIAWNSRPVSTSSGLRPAAASWDTSTQPARRFNAGQKMIYWIRSCSAAGAVAATAIS